MKEELGAQPAAPVLKALLAARSCGANAGAQQGCWKPAWGMLESAHVVAGVWVAANFWLVAGRFPGKVNDLAFKQ